MHRVRPHELGSVAIPEEDQPDMPTLSKQDAPLTIAQVAEFLQCNHHTVRRMISRGELRAYRLGASQIIRISRSDLDKAFKPVTSMADCIESRGGDAA